MPAVELRREHLPTSFAVFPLPGALLLPRGKLPLNIFEPRYVALVEDSLSAPRMFGMIQPDQRTPRAAAGPALYRVGCLGRLSSFSETDDGRFLITLTGLARFAIVDELEMRRGYRRVQASFDDFLQDLRPAPEEKSAAFDRNALLSDLRRYFAANGFEANWEAIQSVPDDMLVITLSMICPFEPVEKQALLEAATEADRAGALRALLQIAASGPQPHPPSHAAI